jgi:hypothetical protein
MPFDGEGPREQNDILNLRLRGIHAHWATHLCQSSAATKIVDGCSLDLELYIYRGPRSPGLSVMAAAEPEFWIPRAHLVTRLFEGR